MDGDTGTLVPMALRSTNWPAPSDTYVQLPVLLPENMTLERLEKTFDIGNLKIEDLELLPVIINIQPNEKI